MEIVDFVAVVVLLLVFYKPVLRASRWLVDRAWKFLSDL